MASESDILNNIENIKNTVKKSFAGVYASLKARELKTLRQLDAIRKQCQDDNEFRRNCVQNVHVSYENESTLLSNIRNYGTIDFEKLNFNSNTFTLEDYISPNDDHMYCYKTIEDLSKETGDDLEAIQEAALKQITSTENCVCFVQIRSEDVSKRFNDTEPVMSPTKSSLSSNSSCEVNQNSSITSAENTDLEQNCFMFESVGDKCEILETDNSDEVRKKDPTDEWLESIKNQTETEPSQTVDVMEQSTMADVLAQQKV